MSEDGPSQLRFDDGKDAQALRTIGELANALGIRQHVLRYWEQQFPMLEPLKRSGGRRYYRPADVALVQTIDRLVNREGYTLKGARQAIAGGMVEPAVPAAAAPRADILRQLRAIRERLADALEAA
jgi:DNA-binding transcriptional MerR regulator